MSNRIDDDEARRAAVRAIFHSHSSRADLHVHSKYSNRPSEWLLRRIGAPECFVEPKALYNTCRNAGMNYVTISDHNCIDGGLEIADLPGAFLSVELTTYFPEDRCKIHCLVAGITPEQFQDLQRVRANIYDLRDYLLANRLFHSIAHPLFRVNDKLTIAHVEKLILLFNCFERLNGMRAPLADRVSTAIFDQLTPQLIEALANDHGITPSGPTPWVKHFTGGSDDHSGLYCASAYTVTPVAASLEEFLEHLHRGNHQPGGKSGGSLKLADSLLIIAAEYYQQRLHVNPGQGSVLAAILSKLTVRPPNSPPPNRVRAVLQKLSRPLLRRQYYRQASDLERDLLKELSRVAEGHLLVNAHAWQAQGYDARFTTAAGLAHRLGYAFLRRCCAQIQKGSLLGGLQAVASLVPVAIGMTPYLTAFSSQHKDDRFLRDLYHAKTGRALLPGGNRKAWLTDTFNEVNGVAKTVATLSALARKKQIPLTVVTCLPYDPVSNSAVRNFPPIGMFTVPDYPTQQLAFPPFMEMLAWLEEAGIDEILISTPGPVGIVGIAAARLLGIPVRGIYHTDFPRYIEDWTDDQAMVELARRCMRWFYGQMDRIYAPTRAYVAELVKLGFDESIIDVMPHGVDTSEFNPENRQDDFWKSYNLNGAYKFIYVGRVSREKNLDVLLEAHRLLSKQGIVADLAVVGDGPDYDRLRRLHSRANVVFTGYLHGKRLATAYASSDALVFPSMTDTFGNVVLEAHASGLPAIVSDQGGPQEIVAVNNSGLVVDARTAGPLATAMATLVNDQPNRNEYRRRALATAAASRWDDLLAKI